MSTKNLFIYSENNFFLNSISNVFKNKFKISCIVAARSELDKVRDNFKNIDILLLEDFERLKDKKNTNYNNNYIDSSFLKENEDIEILAYKTLDFYNSGGFNFSLVEIRKMYYETLNFSMNLIKKYNPNYVFMTNTPHTYAGIIFTRLCEKKKIKLIFKREITIPGFFYFQKSLFNKVLSNSGVNNFSSNEIYLELKDYFNKVATKDTKYIKKIFLKKRNRLLIESNLLKIKFFNMDLILFYFGNLLYRIFSDSFKILLKYLTYLKKKSRENPFYYMEDLFKIKNKKLFDSNGNLLQWYLALFKADIRKFKLLKKYRSQVVQISKKEKYVYFALHYQPEATTYPFGNRFIDQINAIKLISSALPNNIKIYVKEHPDTFNIGRDGWVIGDNSRDSNFYTDLCKINNVRLISMEHNSLELLEKSIGVATINGAVGFEGAINRKPVALFGNSWLDTCPGIKVCNNLIDVHNFINACISKKKNNIKEQEFFNFLSKWSKSLFNYKDLNVNINKNSRVQSLLLKKINS
jgi:hypothetical protein